jgi:predicted RNase H-like nuclease
MCIRQAYIGVDGCPTGWLAIAHIAEQKPVSAVFPTIAALHTAYPNAQRVLIDIPIGLPDDQPRACDAAARRMLQGRRSSVFPVPVRAAVYAEDYPTACDVNQAATGKRISKQAWNITPKMREVDTFLRGGQRGYLLESHPEVVFTALAGAPMRHSKKSGVGFLERVDVLRRHLADVEAFVYATRAAYKPAAVADDDILDALVLAVAARCESLRTLPADPPTDAHGLPMEIVYPPPALPK